MGRRSTSTATTTTGGGTGSSAGVINEFADGVSDELAALSGTPSAGHAATITFGVPA